MKIGFDSLALCAVVHEIKRFAGAQVQRIVQLDAYTVVLGMYGPGEGHLLLSCDPLFYRAHFVTKRYRNPDPIIGFCSQLRQHLEGTRLVLVEQIGFDRIIRLVFRGENGSREVIAELMGKHSNLILVGQDGVIIACAKSIRASQSKRVVMAGKRYEPPPFERRDPIYLAPNIENLKAYEGASPTLIEFISTGQVTLDRLKEIVERGQFEPTLKREEGAYPLPIEGGQPKASLSIALEIHFDSAVDIYRLNQLRQSLLGHLKRVQLAREMAIHDLETAADVAMRANTLQMQGELILSYGHSLQAGSRTLDVYDYEGQPLTISINPDLTFKDNAQKLFDKAKKAKQGSAMVDEQLRRFRDEKDQIGAMIDQINECNSLEDLEAFKDQASRKRWLMVQTVPSKDPKERPFEGHKVKELHAPGGWRVVYGENAEANDYVTTRMGKGNDLWFHVRGGTSAHVLLIAGNQPEKVGREALEFAAKVAALNSVSKHSSFVPVDYTLKKHVRKPRGSAKGFAVYDHEKTIHIDCKKKA